jgi:hypothetical protein
VVQAIRDMDDGNKARSANRHPSACLCIARSVSVPVSVQVSSGRSPKLQHPH